MKEHLISNKLLFFIPFLCLCAIFLVGYNVNFSINGVDDEYFLYETFLLIIINSLIVLVFRFILSKFVKNEQLIFIDSILLVFALFPGVITKVFFVFMLIFSLFYKNNVDSINVFLEIFIALFSVGIFVFFGINSVKAIIGGVSYLNRIKHYNETKKIVVDNTKKKPNIYWFHMDGMPNTNFMNTYYNNSLDEFHNELANMNFMENKEASFTGGYHTITALNSLVNPDFYDNYLGSYLTKYSECKYKGCKTKYISDYKDLIYRRLNNELFDALNKGGYTTVAITEFNQYTSFNSDYTYDISNNSNKCRVPYFEKNHSNDEIYKNILKLHFKYVLYNYYNTEIVNDEFYEKYIDCDVNLDNYPNIKNGDFIPNRMIINALNDSRDKDSNPKFYFIDNVLVHKFWNYDSNGKFIRYDNINLDDYDDAYIYTTKVLLEFIKYIKENDSDSVIVIQGDHGIHVLSSDVMKKYFNIDDKEVLNIRNSTINMVYVPEEYKNGDEAYLSNPLNISRYLINNYIGDNYEYIKR